MPTDKTPVNWDSSKVTKNPAPPENKRDEVILNYLRERGEKWTPGVSIMVATNMRSDELYPPMDRMIGEGKIEIRNDEAANRQVFRIAQEG